MEQSIVHICGNLLDCSAFPRPKYRRDFTRLCSTYFAIVAAGERSEPAGEQPSVVIERCSD
jgi:hypothetical protein